MVSARAPFPVLVLSAVLGPTPSTNVRFEDVAPSSGRHFTHYNAATDEKFMVETMGSGGGFFDYDSDGDVDVYLVNGAPLPGSKPTAKLPSNALFRNDAGQFLDVTRASGLGHEGYGMGLAAADIDNDGDLDLYVTNFGDNVLYRNNGDGTFTDVTASAGVAAGAWSTSAAFGDADGDGFVDLFVCRYVNFSLENHKFCGDLARGIKAYCHPDVYDPLPSLLFKNNGDGTFVDITADAGVFVASEGKSLGVVWGDYDNDGDADLYVANDSRRNFLFRNGGGGNFEDVTLLAGVGYSEDGATQAGMGTDMADYDGDGWLDIIVTNLDFEYNALYRGDASEIFVDQSFDSGIAEPSLNYVGFGTFFFDFDNDADLDLFVANGHIIDNVHRFKDTTTYAERNFLFQNLGDGTFREVARSLGAALQEEDVARGAAPGDYDLDGDEDILLTRVGQSVRLLQNLGGNENGWIALRLVGRRSNRDGIGARVTVEVGGRRYFKEVKAGRSYLSQGALEVLFGLGEQASARHVEIRWPSGLVTKLGEIPSGSRWTVVEGLGRP